MAMQDPEPPIERTAYPIDALLSSKSAISYSPLAWLQKFRPGVRSELFFRWLEACYSFK
jgi:hypothetical protein